MHKSIGYLFLCLGCISLLGAGCYRTVVSSPGAISVGPEHTQRQWFTVGGLVPLSETAGTECGEAGLAYAESQMGITDVVINVGLGVAGGLLGGISCDASAEPEIYAACVQGAAAMLPFLFSARTVKYACASRRRGHVELPLIPGTPTASTAPAEAKAQ